MKYFAFILLILQFLVLSVFTAPQYFDTWEICPVVFINNNPSISATPNFVNYSKKGFEDGPIDENLDKFIPNNSYIYCIGSQSNCTEEENMKSDTATESFSDGNTNSDSNTNSGSDANLEIGIYIVVIIIIVFLNLYVIYSDLNSDNDSL